ncbi:3' exoribonuclease family domain 1 protein [Gregarina niphandrodes]|uniref:3' exoribonuclease family domain 1 protein n=1 Tax=Gregarina niphandrodes TaxID=110365 RepID=A0A023AXJ8_GRENI|nr:3' exoribonuclease family domain 1 protein [Gregarina niphandrodes]EZG43020.1 3' exoribonuclease family domain 1 protein [Gregarina niphandrodes]|eukprot:XP_011133708.1 3' exoribonuclease family domain 1 protein [Gregarina niphandrodes]
MGVVPTEFGSARVSNGEADVIVGVKADLVPPRLAAPSHGEVFVNVSFAAPAAAEKRLVELGESHSACGLRLGSLLAQYCFGELVFPRTLLCVKTKTKSS